MAERKRKFAFTGNVTVSVYTEVMAESAEEAGIEAEQRSIQSLYHQCSTGDAKREWSLTGELDGEVCDIREDS